MCRFVFRFALTVAFLAVGLLFLNAQYVGIVVAAEPQANAEAMLRVFQIQRQHNPRILSLNGVVGTATGVDAQGRWAVKVYTKKAGVAGIPQIIDNVPVQVEVTGEIFALKPPAGGGGGGGSVKIDPTSYFTRPVPIGVSTGNANEASAGTIGCRVKDENGNVYALSNNHVYAREGFGSVGEKIVQPGKYDMIRHRYNPNDAKYDLGTLCAFVPIDFTRGDNTVDAAIALCSTSELGNATPSNGYGLPLSTTGSAKLGQAVQKYGRTTSLTKGTVSGINVTVAVSYTSGTATFINQVVVTSRQGFILAGDSGSLLVTNDRTPVGLLFAGNQNGTYAIANEIGDVLDELGAIAGVTLTIDGQ
ncbi:MAG: Nal1-like putative serine protease [Pirellulales bacterium]